MPGSKPSRGIRPLTRVPAGVLPVNWFTRSSTMGSTGNVVSPVTVVGCDTFPAASRARRLTVAPSCSRPGSVIEKLPLASAVPDANAVLSGAGENTVTTLNASACPLNVVVAGSTLYTLLTLLTRGASGGVVSGVFPPPPAAAAAPAAPAPKSSGLKPSTPTAAPEATVVSPSTYAMACSPDKAANSVPLPINCGV